METTAGLEPATCGFADRYTTIVLRRQEMVGVTGFEPATFCSQSRRSTRLSHTPRTLPHLPDSPQGPGYDRHPDRTSGWSKLRESLHALQLSMTCSFALSLWVGSNHRPTGYEPGTLPLSYTALGYIV